jgi:hypothetical protein
MQKFRDVLGRWERKELSAMEAGELLGCSERQFRRYRERYEEEGLAGLIDNDLAGHRPNESRPMRSPGCWKSTGATIYMGWNVKHFHEQLQKRPLGLHLDKDATELHIVELVPRAKRSRSSII